MDFPPFAGLLLDLCAAAAAETLPRFRAQAGVIDKGGAAFDPVTEADRAAEHAIRRRIAERHPSHGVVGEEEGEDRAEASHVWVIDPIDGTRAFLAGLPVWTTLIALMIDGEPALGAIAQPYLGEIFIGGPGHPARLLDRHGARPLGVRTCATLAEATVATTDPALFDAGELTGWNRLAAAAKLNRLGCDAYAMAMLAAGHIDVVAEAGLKPWDVAAPRAVVLGAGGVVSDWEGGPTSGAGRLLFAGDARVAAAAVAVLANP